MQDSSRLPVELESLCRGLAIREALMMGPDDLRPPGADAPDYPKRQLLAAHGIPAARRHAAAVAASELPRGRFHRAPRPPFRSRFLLALDVPLDLAGARPPLLVVGCALATAGTRRRAGMLARQLRAHLENSLLRERAHRIGPQAVLGELLLHTAHEISNPLANVVGFAELLNSQWKQPSRARATARRLRAEADRARDIARGILSLAQRNGNRHVVDWNALVKRALQLRGGPLRLAAVHVNTEWRPDNGGPVRVYGPPIRLQQAVLNILLNAEQALDQCPYPRRLVVRTGRQPGASRRGRAGRALTEIANNGPPIPAAVLQNIFEPFFTTKPAGEGTGLGLSMAREAVEDAGGRITAENLAPGELFQEGGVRFRLDLPATTAAGLTATAGAGHPERTLRAATRARKKFGAGGAARLPACRVLVVEDEPLLGGLLKEMLAEIGCRARLHSIAGRALADLTKNDYDLVISDMKLPGHDGPWLFEQLRRRRPELAGRTLFITGDTVSPAARRFLRASGRQVLPKPFHLDELRAAVERLLASTEKVVRMPRKARV